MRKRLFILILVCGVALRLWGINWGLPERIALHPDEHDYVITKALAVSFHHPDPVFINYPSFLCYSTALIGGGLRHLGWIHADWTYTLIGRLISALYGILTIPMIWLLARRLRLPAPAPLLAALWVALLPLHIWESHVAVTDVMMTFWIIATLYTALRLLEPASSGQAMLCGVCLGLATGSKYTAALTAVAPILAIVMGRRSHAERLKLLFVVGTISLLACFIVTPFSFIRFPDLLHAMACENNHVHGHQCGFSIPAYGLQYHRYIYQLFAAWPFSFGLPLYLCAVVGAVWFLRHLNRPRLIVIVFFALIFGVTGSWTFIPLRYYMPLVVLGAMFAATWLASWMNAGGKRRITAQACLIVVLFYTVAFDWSTTRRYGLDTRIQADHWIRQHVKSGEHLLICGSARYAGMVPNPPGMCSQHYEDVLNAPHILKQFDYVEISSLHYLRWIRIHYKARIGMYLALQQGQSGFDLAQRFDVDYLNRHFYGKLDPMFRSYWVAPRLEIYRRRSTKKLTHS